MCLWKTYGTTRAIGTTSSSITGVKMISSQSLQSYATTLGTENWINDVKNEDGSWKYNNGYPILKWQLEQ